MHWSYHERHDFFCTLWCRWHKLRISYVRTALEVKFLWTPLHAPGVICIVPLSLVQRQWWYIRLVSTLQLWLNFWFPTVKMMVRFVGDWAVIDSIPHHPYVHYHRPHSVCFVRPTVMNTPPYNVHQIVYGMGIDTFGTSAPVLVPPLVHRIHSVPIPIRFVLW